MNNICRRSGILNFGVYSLPQHLHSESDFLVVRISSTHADSRKRKQNELRVLRTPTEIRTTVQIHEEPLLDDQGIFGFRMEYLNKIPIQDRAGFIGQARDAAEEVCRARFAHGDLSFSNAVKVNTFK